MPGTFDEIEDVEIDVSALDDRARASIAKDHNRPNVPDMSDIFGEDAE